MSGELFIPATLYPDIQYPELPVFEFELNELALAPH